MDRPVECRARLKVPFVSVDDLRTNKLATGRLRDQADAADLPPGNGGLSNDEMSTNVYRYDL